MQCPFCQNEDTRVVDSRLADEGDSVRRRRECQACSERFTTFERAELRLPQMIKSDNRREPFSEEKLRAGMMRALQKRPVDTDAVEEAIHRILHKARASGERELSTQQIGEWVMQELSDLDEVAYVRFASVYHSFQDLDAFSEEVKRLKSQPSPSVKRRQLSLLSGKEESGSGN
ncbi:MAG: transcriptional regulator NrdR [Gammaproteobacteria bacterium]|nr:transcriptional regulator NrdR [Gammaproteobacteria bacterium]